MFACVCLLMVARAPRGGAHYPLFFQLSLSHTPPPPLLDALPAVVRRAGQDALGDDEHRALRPRRRLADRPRLLLCVERRAARVRRWVELCVCVCVAAGRWLFCRATCAARKCVCALTPNQHTHSSKKPNRRAAAAGPAPHAQRPSLSHTPHTHNTTTHTPHTPHTRATTSLGHRPHQPQAL